MSDEHDSWIQTALGLDIARAVCELPQEVDESDISRVKELPPQVDKMNPPIAMDETRGRGGHAPKGDAHHHDLVHPEREQPPTPRRKGPSSANMPVLREGATGPAVKDLQLLLNQNGASLDADGKFGPKTTKAVKDFQAKAGLNADGVVGPNTWDALSAAKPTPPAPVPPPSPPPSPPDTKPRAVIFKVTSEATNNAVSAATVSVAGQSEKTGNTGQATFSLAPGKYAFAVASEGFELFAGNFEVTTNEKTEHHVELKGGGPVPPQSITIKPVNPPPLAAKVTQQFTATDDTGADVTSQVLWSSSDPNIVTIDARGLATAKDVSGTARITATIAPPVGEASKALVAAPTPAAASTTVKVSGSASDKVLVKITISPSGSTMMRHVKQKFTATGFFVDGSEGNLVADSLVVEWKSSKPEFLAIDKKTGVAVANHATTVEITAKDPATGVVSDPVKVTVVDLESIKIIPEKPPSLPAKLQIDFSAVATFSDGTTRPFVVAWESSAEHIVSIDDQTGRATGNSPGNATIKANAGKANPAIHSEVAITVTEGTPPPGQPVYLTDLRRDLQTAIPTVQIAFDAERDMSDAAKLEDVDLENPKSAVASRPPSNLSEQDKNNLHASFAQVDQARVQLVRILHELQATTRELATATKLQLRLKRPPDEPDLTQEQKDRLSQTRKALGIILDGLLQIVPVFIKGYNLAEYTHALLGTDAVKEQISGIDEDVKRHGIKIKELGDKLESTITALQDAANDQLRDLKERWRVEEVDYAEQTKVYLNALRDYQKLVLKVSPKGGGGPNFAKSFAAILRASQTSQSARGALNTERLRPDRANAFLGKLQDPGRLVGEVPMPTGFVTFQKGGQLFSFMGESQASLKDLAKQVQKVNELYKSSDKIDRIFKAWKDALEE